MAFRKGMELLVSLGNFKDFDRGKRIKEFAPADCGLKRGDRLRWVLSTFEGVARVVGVGRKEVRGRIRCSFEKVS